MCRGVECFDLPGRRRNFHLRPSRGGGRIYALRLFNHYAGQTGKLPSGAKGHSAVAELLEQCANVCTVDQLQRIGSAVDGGVAAAAMVHVAATTKDTVNRA